MSGTSVRMLRLLSLLQTHRFWPGEELAERLGVSVRTLRRDVDRLRELGYPVRAQRGVAGGYQLTAGAALPPLVLDDDEAVALALGLQSTAQSTVAGIAESSVRTLATLLPVMPPRLRRRIDAVRAMTLSAETPGPEPIPETDPDVLVVLAQACRDTERLEFDYCDADGRASARRVEPLRLVSARRRWYLVCYDLDRHDWRSFRLDRLSRPHPTGIRFRPRDLPAEDAAAFIRRQLDNVPRPYEIEVLLHTDADTAARRIGRWATLEPVDDEHCVLRMSVDQMHWPATALGLAGVEFTIRSAPELTAMLAEWSERFARAVARGRP
ncbi:helix-turn-helix transcriptional regulator [Nocardia sp. alder85J]|uniref:helix-turn-helix transcriptional regulator n=1 Tax=Nocardia sp. alder85J TaxID=2862949 RepID=UPI001CD1ED84|nr:YafY family protein [Nocardia sp. alder85J]MCX4093888.1 YafY family protein [Nocardia sp. alder85J]